MCVWEGGVVLVIEQFPLQVGVVISFLWLLNTQMSSEKIKQPVNKCLSCTVVASNLKDTSHVYIFSKKNLERLHYI